MSNLELVFPEIFLSLSIMFLLIVGVYKKNSSKLIQNTSLVILLITAVISKIIKEVFWINLELFFLKTPKINKNIIDNERNISGKTNSKFDILIIY